MSRLSYWSSLSFVTAMLAVGCAVSHPYGTFSDAELPDGGFRPDSSVDGAITDATIVIDSAIVIDAAVDVGVDTGVAVDAGPLCGFVPEPPTPSCTSRTLRCLSQCRADFACEARCYAAEPLCFSCIFSTFIACEEPPLCAGVQADLACCMVDRCSIGSPDISGCVTNLCAGQYREARACLEEVDSVCQAAISGCFASTPVGR